MLLEIFHFFGTFTSIVSLFHFILGPKQSHIMFFVLLVWHRFEWRWRLNFQKWWTTSVINLFHWKLGKACLLIEVIHGVDTIWYHLWWFALSNDACIYLYVPINYWLSMDQHWCISSRKSTKKKSFVLFFGKKMAKGVLKVARAGENVTFAKNWRSLLDKRQNISKFLQPSPATLHSTLLGYPWPGWLRIWHTQTQTQLAVLVRTLLAGRLTLT